MDGFEIFSIVTVIGFIGLIIYGACTAKPVRNYVDIMPLTRRQCEIKCLDAGVKP